MERKRDSKSPKVTGGLPSVLLHGGTMAASPPLPSPPAPNSRVVIPRPPLKNQIVNNDGKMIEKRFLTAFGMTPHCTEEQGGSSGGEAAATATPLFSAKRPSFRSEARNPEGLDAVNLTAAPVIGSEARTAKPSPKVNLPAQTIICCLFFMP